MCVCVCVCVHVCQVHSGVMSTLKCELNQLLASMIATCTCMYIIYIYIIFNKQ